MATEVDGAEQALKKQDDATSVSGILEIKEPLLQRTSHHDAVLHHRRSLLLRFMVLSLIILVAVFLLVYAGYLIAIQYLTSQASKHSVRLMAEGGIFYELSVPSFQRYGDAESGGLSGVVENIGLLKDIGVSDIVLSNALDADLELRPEVGSLKALEELLYIAERENIRVFLNLERKRDRRTRDTRALDPVPGATSPEVPPPVDGDEETTEFSCIDGDLGTLRAAIQQFASIGVDGFVINDLPCCFALNLTSNDSNCSVWLLGSLRFAARKYGKPSALLFRPPAAQHAEAVRFALAANGSIFDGVVRLIGSTRAGGIAIPKLDYHYYYLNSSGAPHEVWYLDHSLMATRLQDLELLKLLYAGAAFLPGSLMLRSGDEFGNVRVIAGNYSQVVVDLSTAERDFSTLAADIKRASALAHCQNNSSLVLFDYASDDIFYLVTESAAADASHCAMLINFGDARTEVNMKAHFSSAEVHNAVARIILTLGGDGLFLTNASTNVLSVVTLDPRSATVLQVKRKTA